MVCWSERDSLYRLRGLSLFDLPWPKKIWSDYTKACDAREVGVETVAPAAGVSLLRSAD